MKNLIKYLLTLFVFTAINSCRYDVNDYQWEEAKVICKDKQGVRYISTGGLAKTGCRCNNGEWEFLELYY